MPRWPGPPPHRRRHRRPRPGAGAPCAPPRRPGRPGHPRCGPPRCPRWRKERRRSTGVSRPSREASTTMRWNELLPRSKTATRTVGIGVTLPGGASAGKSQVPGGLRCLRRPAVRRERAADRDVAQLGSAPALGAGGRGFKSRRPDAEGPHRGLRGSRCLRGFRGPTSRRPLGPPVPCPVLGLLVGRTGGRRPLAHGACADGGGIDANPHAFVGGRGERQPATCACWGIRPVYPAPFRSPVQRPLL